MIARVKTDFYVLRVGSGWHPVVMAVDTGATGSIVNGRTAKELRLKLKKSNFKVRTADNLVKNIEGVIGPIDLKIDKFSYRMEFMVLPGEGEDWDILLGNDFLHMADVVIFPKDVYSNNGIHMLT